MTFTSTSYDPESPANVQRWVDETRRWYLSVERVNFGYRVQLQHHWEMYLYPEVVLDYCAGADREWVEALVTVLRESLRSLDPVTTTGYQLWSRYPRPAVKPMSNDGHCWRSLCELARVDYTQLVADIGDVDFDYQRAHLVNMYLQHVQAGINPEYAHQMLTTLSSFLTS